MSKVSSYKGHPTISLDAGSKYPFTFGLAKAKLILAHLEEIKAFVARHETSAPDRVDMAYEDDCQRRTGA